MSSARRCRASSRPRLLLRHYGNRLPESEKLEILDSIAAGVKRMTRMLDRVLLLGKADAQMLEFEPHPLDLQALCEQLVEEAHPQQPDNLCELRLDYTAGTGRGLYDEKLLRHIFSNLLSNAVKYSPLGGLVLFRVRTEEDMVILEVADEGIGIPGGRAAAPVRVLPPRQQCRHHPGHGPGPGHRAQYGRHPRRQHRRAEQRGLKNHVYRAPAGAALTGPAMTPPLVIQRRRLLQSLALAGAGCLPAGPCGRATAALRHLADQRRTPR